MGGICRRCRYYTLEGRVEPRVPLEYLDRLEARDCLDRRVLRSELKLPIEKVSKSPPFNRNLSRVGINSLGLVAV